MTAATASDMRARIAAGRPGLVDATIRLVEVATENPPGRGYAECVEALGELLHEADLEGEVVGIGAPGEPRSAVRSCLGQGPTLLFHPAGSPGTPAAGRSRFA